jgi:putative peptidoglycan lipid II flippase
MFAIVLGQITGLIRGILVARAFPDFELDAFFAANQVSETLFTLLAAGALSSAFIPTITGFIAKGDKASTWKLASSIANLLILTLSSLAALAAIFAPQIVRYALAPGFSNEPALFSLTVNLLRIQLVSAVLFGLGGLIVGILNAHQVFLIPALTPSMYQLGMIFGVLVLAPTMGIYGLAWGVVIGAALYLLLQIPSLLKQKGKYSPILGFEDSAVREVFRLMGPRVLGAAVVQLNFWVNVNLASRMVDGSVAGLRYGFSLMLMAQAIIAQSVAIAAMPTFSTQFALGKLDEMRHSLASSIRGVIFLALPASIGLILLREPIITMLYQRGEFDARMTSLVAWALLWYAVGMVGHSVLEVLTRAFYAQHDTKTPVTVGVIAMGLNVVFSFAFSSLFDQIGWMPHGGLALANTIATALEVTTLLILMRKRLNGMNESHILRGGLQTFAGTLAMSFAVILCLRFFADRSAWLLTISGILSGGLVYALTMMALRVPELDALYKAVRQRLL